MNYSVLFSLFTHDQPDKTGALLEKIGKISFTLSLIGAIFGSIFNDNRGAPILVTIGFGLFAVGFIVGLCMFLATGIHYAGREKGKPHFFASTAYVLKNTFLYILLPAIIITTVMVIWGVIAKAPAFQ